MLTVAGAASASATPAEIATHGLRATAPLAPIPSARAMAAQTAGMCSLVNVVRPGPSDGEAETPGLATAVPAGSREPAYGTLRAVS